jgi:hypothetical protein
MREGLDEVAIRPATPADQGAVDRLRRLDGRPRKAGGWLLCEVDDRLVAALELDHGWTAADPFEKTSHLVELLELRRRQLQATQVSRSPLRRFALRLAWRATGQHHGEALS